MIMVLVITVDFHIPFHIHINVFNSILLTNHFYVDCLEILREMTLQQLQEGLESLQQGLTTLTVTLPRFFQAIFEEGFQAALWNELSAMRLRVQRLEKGKAELEEKVKQAVEGQKQLQEQVLQTRRRGRRLRQATEQALNGLFETVHVSLVGDVLAL